MYNNNFRKANILSKMVDKRKIRRLINKLVEGIRIKYKPEKIILFGSYVYGKPSRNSDIDFLIVKNTSKRPLDRRVEVRKIIYDQKRRVPVSPLVFTEKEIEECLAVNDYFIEEIIRKGKILYER